MADQTVDHAAADLSLDAVEVEGTVYVIDLVGFSQLTEQHFAESGKSGTEHVTQLITALFSDLMMELTAFEIEYGGVAGDALIAWQKAASPRLSETELQMLVARVCGQVWEGLTCRTAQAQGRFWMAASALSRSPRPLVWGGAVADAFTALEHVPSTAAETSPTADSVRSNRRKMMATASVDNRWSIVLRALTPEACKHTQPEKLQEILLACHEVCDAFSAEIDNVVQDDKGLLLIIVMPQNRRAENHAVDAAISSLTTGRQPIIDANAVRKTFGLLFRCRLTVAQQHAAITIGTPINQAAKALAEANANPHPPKTIANAPVTRRRELIGREHEIRVLRQALRQSEHVAQTVSLTGVAGIGKTAVVHEICNELASNSVHIEVTPGSRFLPFGCAQDLAEACDVPVQEVFRGSGPATLAAKTPRCVVIENWQWCDAESKRLLRQMQSMRQSGLLLITSRHTISDFDTDCGIDIEPLNLEQASQLIETLAPNQLDAARKQTVFDVSSGTPFWIAQAALLYADRANSEDQLSETSGLESLLTARAQSLSEPAIALWRLHCAWRLPLTFHRARDILSKFKITISPQHHEALSGLGWLQVDPRDVGNGSRPTHDILADWGVADLPVTFERELHTQIARTVTHENGSPSRIARHWQMSGQNLRSAIWFERAAQSADRAGAHELTLDHLRQAETLAPQAQSLHSLRQLRRLALSATANWGVGKLRRAKHDLIAFDSASKALPNSARKRIVLQRAATILSEVGQFAGNSQFILTGMYRGWRNRRGNADAYEVKARREGFIYYMLGLIRLPVAGKFNRLVNQSHEAGEYRSQALLGCAAGTLHMTRGEWSDAEAVLVSCHQAIAQTDDRQMLGVVQCLQALAALYQGKTETSHAWFERVARIGAERDHHLFKVWGAYGKAETHLYSGNIAAAKRDAIDARNLSVGLGDLQSVCIIEGVLAQVELIERNLEYARKHARNAMRFAAKLPPTNFSTLEGIAAAAQVGCGLKEQGLSDPDIDEMIRTGRKALNAYARVFPIARPRQHYVDGLIAQTRGNDKRALHLITKARKTAETLGMTYDVSLAEKALPQNKETRHDAAT